LPLHDDFLLEDALRREVVFDILEGGQDRLTIGRDILIVGCAGGLGLCGAQTGVEDCCCELWAQGPEARRRGQQL
jgi:hypothetical protein